MLLQRLFLLASMPLFCMAAPDRIGNGGGVWVCEDDQSRIHDIMFMDVFEARREYQLTLPETNGSPLELVQSQKSWIEKSLQNGAEINKHISYVEKNITWIEDIINLIPDGANKISPHPSTCKQGDWTAVQLVNFTEDFRILVRRELFESEFLTNMERAAVYLHEGLYSYLRTSSGDTTSVRARAVVGYLLSDLSDAEKTVRIQKVLQQDVTNPQPTPANTWICGIKPDSHTALYIAEDSLVANAKAAAIKACIDGENPFGKNPGFPGVPGIPSIPGGPSVFDFGPGSNCKETKVLCEAVTSQAKNKTCTIVTRFDQKTFTGSGRTSLEAQKETMNICLANTGLEHECYSASNLICK